VVIDYENPENNVFEVTEEYYCHNGKHGTREDIVFFINGVPVLVIECKNATKDEAIALGVDQVRRYHAETPELFVPQMVFTATAAIGFSYGVTWNLLRRNIFNWKNEQKGNLEAKVKSFCDRGHVLALLKDYILFAEKDEELQKFILRQHQTKAVERVVERCLTAPPKPEARRGLVWHTQGSGKTFTMIKAAELLFKAAGADKPTVLVLIDRNELEDQMLRNLAMLGLNNVQHAHSIAALNKLLKDDYRGIVVSTIHKFQGMAANLNARPNIFVMIDEAHRTTGGDLGNYLMAGIPNAVSPCWWCRRSWWCSWGPACTGPGPAPRPTSWRWRPVSTCASAPAGGKPCGSSKGRPLVARMRERQRLAHARSLTLPARKVAWLAPFSYQL
jgi:type I restriction enzyme R subunit